MWMPLKTESLLSDSPTQKNQLPCAYGTNISQTVQTRRKCVSSYPNTIVQNLKIIPLEKGLSILQRQLPSGHKRRFQLLIKDMPMALRTPARLTSLQVCLIWHTTVAKMTREEMLAQYSMLTDWSFYLERKTSLQ